DRAAIEQGHRYAVFAFDLAGIADRPQRRMVTRHLRIVEEVNVRPGRRTDFHNVFEYEELLAGKRALHHTQPGVAGQESDAADHRTDRRAHHSKPDQPAPMRA